MSEGSKYPLEAAVSLAADGHRQESKGAGCSCGFAVWSGEHVAIMAYREAVDYAEFCDSRYGGRDVLRRMRWSRTRSEA